MKTLKIMFAILFAFALTQTVQAQSNKSDRVKGQANSIVAVQYACSMHPDVTSDKPGKCSKCGMDLNLSKKEQLKLENVKYSCTMHPEVISYENGKCPKCGKNLHLSKKEQRKLEIANGYTCPMHSDVVSDKPGKCSKCGMYLAKVKTKVKA